MTTWKCKNLTFERYNYCKSLGYDVLSLTELWDKKGKFQDAVKEFIVSEAIQHKKGPNKGKTRFPQDKAAGVGILLSIRMQNKVMTFGSAGARVCWVRLRGPPDM